MSSGLLAPFLRLEAAMLPRNATLQKLDLGLGAQRLKAAGPAGPAGPRRAPPPRFSLPIRGWNSIGDPGAVCILPFTVSSPCRREGMSQGRLGGCAEAEHGSH